MQIYLHCLCVDTIFTSAKVLKIFDIGKFWGWECVENLHFACNPPGYQLSMEEIIEGNIVLYNTGVLILF